MPSRFLIATVSLISLATINGCAGDSYLVERYQMDRLNETAARQQADITQLRLATESQHQEIVTTTEAATSRILDAISTQVEPPSCPPPAPRQSACEGNGQGGGGDSDRYQGKLVVGEVEKVYLEDPGFIYDARIDSGANTSSMDARNIQRFERDGNNWVRFDIPAPGEPNATRTIEREIVRNVRIIQAATEDGDGDRRPVVELQFRIGSHKQKAEFTLNNRSHLSHPMLIGRNILRDIMLIDVGKEYATELPGDLATSQESGQ